MPKELDWTDIIRNQLQLVDELLNADLQKVERLRHEPAAPEAALQTTPDTPAAPSSDIPTVKPRDHRS